MLIKVLKSHPHGGKTRKVKSVYNCPTKKARLLIALGKAELAPKSTYQTRQLVAEAPPPPLMGVGTSPVITPEGTEIELGEAALVEAEIEMTSSARKILEENNIDPSTVVGTGVGGKITKADAEKAAE